MGILFTGDSRLSIAFGCAPEISRLSLNRNLSCIVLHMDRFPLLPSDINPARVLSKPPTRRHLDIRASLSCCGHLAHRPFAPSWRRIVSHLPRGNWPRASSTGAERYQVYVAGQARRPVHIPLTAALRKRRNLSARPCRAPGPGRPCAPCCRWAQSRPHRVPPSRSHSCGRGQT